MALTVGDVLPFATSIYNTADPPVLVNAGNMRLTVTAPDGTVTIYDPVTPTTTGKYDKDHTSTMVGRYVGYWLATGSNSGAHTQVFVVESAADISIVSLAQVRKHLQYRDSNTSDDEELELFLRAATETIEDRVGPIVRRTVVNERHHGGGRVVYLNQAPGPHGNPYVTLTSVLPVAGGTGIPTIDLLAEPDGRVSWINTYGWFPTGPYYWSYVAGRATVPAKLQLAALNYIKGSWETQRGASGLPLQSADDMAEVPGMGLVMWRLEQDLRPFLRTPAVA